MLLIYLNKRTILVMLMAIMIARRILMIDKLFTILIWLLIAAAIWLWIRLIIFVALLIVLW